MNKFGVLLTRYRNVFLLALLFTTLMISGISNARNAKSASITVDIPIVETAAASLSPLESYRRTRDQETREDIASLEQLISQTLLDEATRQAAADRLQEIIDTRQAQSAMEGALSGSSLSPCVAVVAGDSLSIVTAKTTITPQDSALVMTLAAAHAGILPENVQILSATN